MNTVMETLPQSALGWNSLASRLSDSENGSDFVDSSTDHFMVMENKYDSRENSRDRNSSCMTSIHGLSSKRSKNNCVDSGARFHANSISSPVVKVEDVSSDSLLSDNSNSGLGAWNSSNCGNDAAQMDIYRDLILRHLIQDISTTCAKLSLPTDPFDWTVDQCSRWINEMCVQFQLPTPANLRVDGRSLLNMTPEEFCARTPQGGGDTLHAQLQLWKTAFESYQQQQQQPQQVPYQQKGTNKGMQANSDWLSPSSPNEPNMCSTNPSERLPSVQGYLNNFSQTTTDVNSSSLNYYNVAGNGYPSSCAESVESPSSLVTSQQFFPGVQHSNLLPSPSDTSDLSSNASSVMEDDCMDHLQLLGIQRGRQSQMQYGSGLGENNCFGPLGGLEKSGNEHSSAGVTPFQRSSGTVHLWHFIRELLDHPKQYSSCVRWVDREEGTFKIESSHHLARFWGQRKNRSQMNYDKLSRSLRQYYKKGIIQKPEKKQRLVYKFLPPYNL